MSVRILHGDCRSVLPMLPEKSVQCCVTSPPYFGLRDYGVDGQIGLEPTPEEYVAEMVAVFREVRRVLRDDGTVWLNIGDSYAPVNRGENARPRRETMTGLQTGNPHSDIPTRRELIQGVARSGVKQKDLLGIPWMVAFALRADGWFLRAENIWAKRNCMPESVQDRTTRAHEHVFLLTKSGDDLFWTHRCGAGSRKRPEPDYRWIHRATKEERSTAPAGWPEAGKDTWRRVNLWDASDYFYDAEAVKEEGAVPSGTRAAKGSNVRSELKDVNGRPPEYWEYTGTRNLRSVWWIGTKPFAGSHFAVMPTELAELCIMAGTSERGCCPACSAPWVRRTASEVSLSSGSGKSGRKPTGKGAGGVQTESGDYDIRMGPVVTTATVGWQPSCDCPAADPVPCIVIDPFSGAGTTALVADRLGRSAIGIELNPDYAAMGSERVRADAPLFAQVSS